MADSGSSELRQMIVGAAIAGVVAVLMMFVLTSAQVGSSLVRAVIAIAIGLVVAQLYERGVA